MIHEPVAETKWECMTPEQVSAECHRRIENLDSTTLLRFSYVPFCIAEGCWDYADTVIDMAILIGDQRTKPLSRAIRKLRRMYEQKRQLGTRDNGISFAKSQEVSLKTS